MRAPAVWLVALLVGLAAAAPVGGATPARGGQRPAEPLIDHAADLGVTPEELEQILGGCRAAGFTREEVERVLHLVERAKLAGLPQGDLVNKLREGLAKGVSPEGIGRALERKAQTLKRAKSLVDTLVVDGWEARDYRIAVQLVADALDAGLSPAEVLRSVRQGHAAREGMPDVRTAFQGFPPPR